MENFLNNFKMKNIKLVTSILITIFAFTSTAFAASIQIGRLDLSKLIGSSRAFENTNKCFDEIKIIGEIKDGDSIEFLKNINQFIKINKDLGCRKISGRGVAVSINSKGGSIYESMKIGRIIRENEFETRVYKNENCASSCVLIFGSGINKISLGELHVHRPYFSDLDGKLTYKEIQKLRYKLIDEMKNYATEMDFSINLIDFMMSIPPEKIYTLNIDEIEKYRLIGDDPTFEEKEVAKRASQYGMNSSEYRIKRFEADKKCSMNDGECVQAYMLNISITEIKKRIAKVEKVCNDVSELREKCAIAIIRDGK